MPYLVDDVILIEARQEYLGQGVVNTLFYKIIDIVGTAITNALLDLLAEAIIDFITPMQIDSVSHVEQILTNLTDGLSQHTSVYTTVGERTTADAAPSFLAVGMKKSVPTRITRPGSIRVVGLDESNFDGNDLTTAMEVLALAGGVNLSATVIINDLAGSVATFNPVVVGRALDGSFDIARVNDMTSMGLPRLTTQNSRKPSR